MPTASASASASAASAHSAIDILIPPHPHVILMPARNTAQGGGGGGGSCLQPLRLSSRCPYLSLQLMAEPIVTGALHYYVARASRNLPTRSLLISVLLEYSARGADAHLRESPARAEVRWTQTRVIISSIFTLQRGGGGSPNATLSPESPPPRPGLVSRDLPMHLST